MNPVRIKIRKEMVAFTDEKGQDVKMGGIRVMLAPKVEKFITLEDLVNGRKSSAELVSYCNPDLYQWYSNVAYGTEITLGENTPKKLDGVYSVDNNSNSL